VAENAKELFEAEDKTSRIWERRRHRGLDEEMMRSQRMPIFIYPEPLRAIASGEFIEEQIYNWTYSDEQRSKRDWKVQQSVRALPAWCSLTYNPRRDREIAMQGEFNEFD